MLLSSRAPHLHLLCVRGEDVGLIELRWVLTTLILNPNRKGRNVGVISSAILFLQSCFYGVMELRSVATIRVRMWGL